MDLTNYIFEAPTLEKYDEIFVNRSLLKNKETNETSLIIQTPKLENKIYGSSIELLLSRKEKHKNLFQIIYDLEQKAINDVLENTPIWFSKKFSYEKVLNMFQSNMSVSNKDSQFCVLRLPLATTLPETVEGLLATCLIRVDGLILNPKTFKLDLKVIQCKFVNKSKKDLIYKPISEPVEIFFDNSEPIVFKVSNENKMSNEESKEEFKVSLTEAIDIIEAPDEDLDVINNEELPKILEPVSEEIPKPIEELPNETKVSFNETKPISQFILGENIYFLETENIATIVKINDLDDEFLYNLKTSNDNEVYKNVKEKYIQKLTIPLLKDKIDLAITNDDTKQIVSLTKILKTII